MIAKSRTVNALIVALIMAGLGGILWTQRLIRQDNAKQNTQLQAKLDSTNAALADSEATNKAWREALADYNKKIVVPKVEEEPSPTPSPATTPAPPRKVIIKQPPMPSPTPRVITRTIVKRAKPKPTPTKKPWYHYWDSMR